MAPAGAGALTADWAPLGGPRTLARAVTPIPACTPTHCALLDSCLSFPSGTKQKGRMPASKAAPREAALASPFPAPHHSGARGGGGGEGRGYVTGAGRGGAGRGGAGRASAPAPGKGKGGAGGVLSREEPGCSVFSTLGQPPPRSLPRSCPRVLGNPAGLQLERPRPRAGAANSPSPGLGVRSGRGRSPRGVSCSEPLAGSPVPDLGAPQPPPQPLARPCHTSGSGLAGSSAAPRTRLEAWRPPPHPPPEGHPGPEGAPGPRQPRAAPFPLERLCLPRSLAAVPASLLALTSSGPASLLFISASVSPAQKGGSSRPGAEACRHTWCDKCRSPLGPPLAGRLRQPCA